MSNAVIRSTIETCQLEGLPFALTLASMIATTSACDSSFGTTFEPVNAAAVLTAAAATLMDNAMLADETGVGVGVFVPANAAAALAAAVAMLTDNATLADETGVGIGVFAPANAAAALAATVAALMDAAMLADETAVGVLVMVVVCDPANAAADLAAATAALTDTTTLDDKVFRTGEVMACDPTNVSALAEGAWVFDSAPTAFLSASSATVLSMSTAAVLSVSKIPIRCP